MKKEAKWTPREGYALTLDEIEFLFDEFINGYGNSDVQLTIEDIKILRRWIVNAAISGSRL